MRRTVYEGLQRPSTQQDVDVRTCNWRGERAGVARAAVSPPGRGYASPRSALRLPPSAVKQSLHPQYPRYDAKRVERVCKGLERRLEAYLIWRTSAGILPSVLALSAQTSLLIGSLMNSTTSEACVPLHSLHEPANTATWTAVVNQRSNVATNRGR
jgi:hypothetical protein